MQESENYIQIDYDRLMQHPDQVSSCIKAIPTTPITLEIQPTEKCNCNCAFCISRKKYSANEREHMISNGKEIDISILQKILPYHPDNVIISGTTGDPLLYSGINQLLQLLSHSKIPTTIITNGIALSPSLSGLILETCYNIRISLDAVNMVSYAKKHGVEQEKWTTVINNIIELVHMKKERHSACRIGIGYLTENRPTDDLTLAVLLAKQLGADYIDFRPLQPIASNSVSPALLSELSILKQKYIDNNFTIWTSHQKYASLSAFKRTYTSCLASFLYTVITPDGNIFLCCNRIGDSSACYGNLYDTDNWKSLLCSPQKISMMNDLKHCPPTCRLHMYNIILHDLQAEKNLEHLFRERHILQNNQEGVWDAI